MGLIDTGNLLDGPYSNVRKPGDFHRNHMGAPYVHHPTETKKDGTPKRVVYGRPSSFGTALDNAFNLLKWKERQLLIGTFTLLADPDVGAIEFRNDDRDALDQLAARCHQAAGSSLAADRGTHIHLLLELCDRGRDFTELFEAGEELGIPEPLQARVVDQWRVFRYEMGLSHLAIEATIVHDAWHLAGTLDRLDVCNQDIITGFGIIFAGFPFIGDIKTGGLTLGRDGQPNYWVKYPVQLAAYAGGVPYNVGTDERGKWPTQPDDQIALIYHYDLAQALNGEPVDWQAIPVNLTAGREGGDLCRLAADFAKRRDLFLMPTPKENPCAYTTTKPGATAPTAAASSLTASNSAPDKSATSSMSLSSAKPNTTTLPTPQMSEIASDSVDQIAAVAPSAVEPTGGVDAAISTPPVDDDGDEFVIVADDGRRDLVVINSSRTDIRQKLAKLIAAGHEPTIRSMWPAGVPALSQPGHSVEQLTQLFYLVRRVEAEVGAPFDPEPAPTIKVSTGEDESGQHRCSASPVDAAATQPCETCNGTGGVGPKRPSTSTATSDAASFQAPCPDCVHGRRPLDDGAFLDPPEIETLKTRMLALPDDRIVQLAEIAREADAAGRPISVSQKPCVRRWEIARALVLWAESRRQLGDLEDGVIEVATVKQIAGNHTIGAVISLFTIEQAVALADSFDHEVAA